MTPPTRVFVYGTLKPGERYHDRYCGRQVLTAQEALIYGELYDLPFGYPALTWGNRRIYGVLLSFAESSILTALDELENYRPDRPAIENEYQRVQREVFNRAHQSLGLAWVYIMEPERVQQIGTLLNCEYWSGRQEADRSEPQQD
jgi:gamma-glutamylcyclotransferase (GGCT)/AIG2-like uncharacterized protein YtfP